MCGIAGVLDPTCTRTADALRSLCTAMGDSLRHRGPDRGDVWVDARAGIGLSHRRLSIVDLSADGDQPMHSACGRYVLSFNGEIYNFLELRQELESRGRAFKGRSDTEVLLASVVEWGLERALRRFNGMFAFALWDRQTREISLARDRLGEKPLYYALVGGTLLFASEVQAFHAFEDFSAEVDRDALATYLRDLCVPAPHSIYRGVRKLLQGSFLTIPIDKPVPKSPVTYWSAREVLEQAAANRFDGSFDEAVTEVDETIRRAVGLRMLADVPLGAFLSGGIDSTAVVASMQAQSSRRVRTFSIGVTDPSYDEAPFAREVAKHLGTEHTEFYVSADDVMATIPEAASAYDEPFADSSQIPTLLVSRLARQHVTVALTGDGGDELFGGYPRYEIVPRMWKALSLVPTPVRRSLAAALRAIPDDVARGVIARLRRRQTTRIQTYEAPLERVATLLEVASLGGLYQRLTTQWKEASSVVLGTTTSLAGSNTREGLRVRDARQQLMYLDIVGYLPDDLLVKVDRAAMSVSLENRVPLLDPALVELAGRIPMHMRLHRGETKRVLKSLLYRYVPRAMVERPKMGFSIPIGKWLAGPLLDWAEGLLDERRLMDDGYFDARRVRKAWDQHRRLETGWSHHIWIILMFQSWLDRHRSWRASKDWRSTGTC
jgi:asparagine synthase (glutamine-hydrolysing)